MHNTYIHIYKESASLFSLAPARMSIPDLEAISQSSLHYKIHFVNPYFTDEKN